MDRVEEIGKECVRFSYVTAGYPRSKTVLIDTKSWEILEPDVYLDRGYSREDYYCLEENKWERVIVVRISDLDFTVFGYRIERKRKIRKYIEELEKLLRKVESKEDREFLVRHYARARKIASERKAPVKGFAVVSGKRIDTVFDYL